MAGLTGAAFVLFGRLPDLIPGVLGYLVSPWQAVAGGMAGQTVGIFCIVSLGIELEFFLGFSVYTRPEGLKGLGHLGLLPGLPLLEVT